MVVLLFVTRMVVEPVYTLVAIRVPYHAHIGPGTTKRCGGSDATFSCSFVTYVVNVVVQRSDSLCALNYCAIMHSSFATTQPLVL